MVNASCLICVGTLTSQYVIMKGNVAFIQGKAGPLGKDLESGLDSKTQPLLHSHYIPGFSSKSYKDPKRWPLTFPFSTEGSGV